MGDEDTPPPSDTEPAAAGSDPHRPADTEAPPAALGTVDAPPPPGRSAPSAAAGRRPSPSDSSASRKQRRLSELVAEPSSPSKPRGGTPAEVTGRGPSGRGAGHASGAKPAGRMQRTVKKGGPEEAAGRQVSPAADACIAAAAAAAAAAAGRQVSPAADAFIAAAAAAAAAAAGVGIDLTGEDSDDDEAQLPAEMARGKAQLPPSAAAEGGSGGGGGSGGAKVARGAGLVAAGDSPDDEGGSGGSAKARRGRPATQRVAEGAGLARVASIPAAAAAAAASHGLARVTTILAATPVAAAADGLARVAASIPEAADAGAGASVPRVPQGSSPLLGLVPFGRTRVREATGEGGRGGAGDRERGADASGASQQDERTITTAVYYGGTPTASPNGIPSGIPSAGISGSIPSGVHHEGGVDPELDPYDYPHVDAPATSALPAPVAGGDQGPAPAATASAGPAPAVAGGGWGPAQATAAGSAPAEGEPAAAMAGLGMDAPAAAAAAGSAPAEEGTAAMAGLGMDAQAASTGPALEARGPSQASPAEGGAGPTWDLLYSDAEAGADEHEQRGAGKADDDSRGAGGYEGGGTSSDAALNAAASAAFNSPFAQTLQMLGRCVAGGEGGRCMVGWWFIRWSERTLIS